MQRTMIVECGYEIKSSIAKAIREASKNDCLVQFDWDFCTLCVKGDSNPDLLYRDFRRAIYGCLGAWPIIGPYPLESLSVEQIAADEVFYKASRDRAAAQQAEYAAKAKAKHARLQELLENAPAIELIDQDSWDALQKENRDSGGRDIMVYAENWARLMQSSVACGKPISECASETSDLADNGMSGASYSCAVGALIKCWAYGKELEQWFQNQK